jgi:hypothetical protein
MNEFRIWKKTLFAIKMHARTGSELQRSCQHVQADISANWMMMNSTSNTLGPQRKSTMDDAHTTKPTTELSVYQPALRSVELVLCYTRTISDGNSISTETNR